MNIPMLIITLSITLVLLWVIPMFAEMFIFFGAVIFVLAMFGNNSPDNSSMMWMGLASSACSLGIVWVKKKHNID